MFIDGAFVEGRTLRINARHDRNYDDGDDLIQLNGKGRQVPRTKK